MLPERNGYEQCINGIDFNYNVSSVYLLSLLKRFYGIGLRECTAPCSVLVLGLLLSVGVKLLMTYSGNRMCCIRGRSCAPQSPVPLTAIHLQVPKTTVRNFCQKLAFGDVCKEQLYQQRLPSEYDNGMICIIANNFPLWDTHLCHVEWHASYTLDSSSDVQIREGYTIYLFVMFIVHGPLLFLNISHPQNMSTIRAKVFALFTIVA